MGWETDDRDNWTKVRPRWRKERRQVIDNDDSPSQYHRHESIAPFRPRRLFRDEVDKRRKHTPDQHHDGRAHPRSVTEPEVDACRPYDRRDTILQHDERAGNHGDRGHVWQGKDGVFMSVGAGGVLNNKDEDAQRDHGSAGCRLQGMDKDVGTVIGTKDANVNRAKVASFDRSEVKDGRRGGRRLGGYNEGDERPETKTKTHWLGRWPGKGGEGGGGCEKSKADRTGGPLEDDNQNLCLKVLRPIEKEVSGTSVYVRKYCTTLDETNWAQSGIVATVKGSEAVPVIQRRIVDAGFNDLVFIPLGADKFFVRSMTEMDVASVVNSAKEFFSLFLSHWTPWEKAVLPFKRDAWVRLYGIPLHAWNENFFNLCILDCGSFLRADSVQIMEEWGYALGEDACLFVEESEEVASHNDNEGEHSEMEASHQIDMFIEKFAKGMEEDDCMAFQKFAEEHSHNQFTSSVNKEEPIREEDRVRIQALDAPVESIEGLSNQGRVDETVMPVEKSGERAEPVRNLIRSKRTMSCPPGANRSIISGLWSLDWLQDHNHGDVGVIFSTRQKPSKGRQQVGYHHKDVIVGQRKKRAGGLLRHSIYSLKKVARLPGKDRREGTDQIAVDDVCDMGKAIGVKFKGDNANMFDIVKGKSKASGWTGLGGAEKRKEVRKLVGEKHPAIVCNQETNVCVCDENLVSALWWCAPHAFAYRPSVGASEGLLTMWDSLEVEVWSTASFEHVLLCHERFLSSNEIFYVEERQSSRVGPRQSDHVPFNSFIEDNNLVDLPLEEWCLAWPNGLHVAQLRGLLDHCPLVLVASEEDWGPRTLRMLKCWKNVPGYDLFVKEKRNSLQVDGWGGFVLKEKHKMIKVALKEWHKSHVQNLPGKIDSLKTWLSDLDSKGEEEDLSVDEVEDMRGITSNIHSLSRLHASISCRRRGNTISSLQVDGATLEGVDLIRQAVFMHFASHFKASNVVRTGVDNLQFKRLSWPDSGSLTRPFSVDDVKDAVWDCDSFKSPGSDGINLGFFKVFWAELQCDVMRFFSKFHRNGKLTKGVTSTFIALIPKVDIPQSLHDFRPISLVGSIYKILAKVLANRLRLVIGSVISESQTAFVKDRQIPDGILC
ncbi:hypothetical protein TSUD_13210 [Trifolium subterraneum]|uniref:DUF4283 domain-containing protein n=1 Tax=Trifolium subterraneum TaxID=3900 RepID=A0A2Z6P8T1_TRISU|nr:hypothetical protein TSUD_13210 [Trifolium subterraneum]